jgi:hypothetical protein
MRAIAFILFLCIANICLAQSTLAPHIERECAIDSKTFRTIIENGDKNGNYLVEQKVNFGPKAGQRTGTAYLISPTKIGMTTCSKQGTSYNLVINFTNDASKNIVTNLNSNNWNGFAKLLEEQNGFSIIIEYGSNLKCDIKIHFSTKENSVSTQKSSKICYVPNKKSVKRDITYAPSIDIRMVDLDSAMTNQQQITRPEIAFVATTKTYIYKTPDLSTKGKSYLIEGDEISIIERRGSDWVRFSYKNGKAKGWLQSKDLKY